MNESCAAEFPGAPMAYSDEFVISSSPDLVTQEAWVHFRPEIILGTFGGAHVLVDEVGNTSVHNIFKQEKVNCRNWTESDYENAYGQVLMPGGALRPVRCNVAHAVACAAPVE